MKNKTAYIKIAVGLFPLTCVFTALFSIRFEHINTHGFFAEDVCGLIDLMLFSVAVTGALLGVKSAAKEIERFK